MVLVTSVCVCTKKFQHIHTFTAIGTHFVASILHTSFLKFQIHQYLSLDVDNHISEFRWLVMWLKHVLYMWVWAFPMHMHSRQSVISCAFLVSFVHPTFSRYQNQISTFVLVSVEWCKQWTWYWWLLCLWGWAYTQNAHPHTHKSPIPILT